MIRNLFESVEHPKVILSILKNCLKFYLCIYVTLDGLFLTKLIFTLVLFAVKFC